MSTASLTARYRPQKFAEVAGQQTLKAILSRAAAEDKVAPAYLFSGTRGVGKTTIARIFAKALNCRHAPTPEPCNECDQCKAITQGASVDVVEIDGASNRGIDDVRRLKESVGYAPMEGRYKIFIIDEAHMLSREAFNALLKTLEEPPARVTFIMATTEPHKFPITIISRCQHFVFKRLSDHELETHLKNVLRKEAMSFEESAIHLLARRAAGSVRDAMSLLGQVLALGGTQLSESGTRSVLGLAGQELFFDLFDALRQSDCATLSRLVRGIMDEGLDLGFFLRELTQTWRNLFMLRQIGHKALSLIDLPEEEGRRWLTVSEAFDLTYIHAAWQMTLEGQRRILTSLEPSLALELLLFNLGQLPRLLSLEQFSSISRKLGATAPAEKKTPEPTVSVAPAPNQSSPVQETDPPHSVVSDPAQSAVKKPPQNTTLPSLPTGLNGQQTGSSPTAEHEKNSAPMATHGYTLADTSESSVQAAPHAQLDVLVAQQSDSALSHPSPATNQTTDVPRQDASRWAAFVEFCSQDEEVGASSFMGMLKNCVATWQPHALFLTPKDQFTASRLQQSELQTTLERLAGAFDGTPCPVTILPILEKKLLDRSAIKDQIMSMPMVKQLQDILGAEVVDYGPWYQ